MDRCHLSNAISSNLYDVRRYKSLQDFSALNNSRLQNMFSLLRSIRSSREMWKNGDFFHEEVANLHFISSYNRKIGFYVSDEQCNFPNFCMSKNRQKHLFCDDEDFSRFFIIFAVWAFDGRCFNRMRVEICEIKESLSWKGSFSLFLPIKIGDEKKPSRKKKKAKNYDMPLAIRD